MAYTEAHLMEKNEMKSFPDFSAPYEMKFSDGNENNGNHKRNSSSQQPGNKGYLRLILIVTCFIALVSVMLYFFVFRSTSEVVTYSGADVVYKVDYDQNGAIDEHDKITEFETNANTKGKSLGDFTVEEGRLAQILLHPSYGAQDNTSPYANLKQL